ncbi:adenosylhomocysteinase [bacterium]|nr:adenosylhomocysteinase [bacterium]
MVKYHIKNIELADEGLKKIEWAGREMPVLKLIGERFEKEKPLKGVKIGGCLHITSETANLALTLQKGGAQVFLCASNPLSTQDEVAAALVKFYGISVFAIKGEDRDTYYSHILSVLQERPLFTIDDGADLVTTLHTKRTDLLGETKGGTEETTTGVIRLRSMAKDGVLKYPIIAVNDARSKYLFDNRYGTGQSTIDGILRATNILIAGKKFVIFGYGWCGRGVAMRARGMGAQVIICEVDPFKALEAVMDGYQVLNSLEAAKVGDIFVTVTGDKSVLREEHFKVMKDGAILANSGHFDVEIDIPALEKLSLSKRRIRPMVDEYLLPDGRKIYLLAEGRLVNLAAAEGHPSSVMDMSFATQALCVEYLAKHSADLKPDVYLVPVEVEETIARLKLSSMGITIDELTPEQKRYLASWAEGT